MLKRIEPTDAHQQLKQTVWEAVCAAHSGGTPPIELIAVLAHTIGTLSADMKLRDGTEKSLFLDVVFGNVCEGRNDAIGQMTADAEMDRVFGKKK